MKIKVYSHRPPNFTVPSSMNLSCTYASYCLLKLSSLSFFNFCHQHFCTNKCGLIHRGLSLCPAFYYQPVYLLVFLKHWWDSFSSKSVNGPPPLLQNNLLSLFFFTSKWTLCISFFGLFTFPPKTLALQPTFLFTQELLLRMHFRHLRHGPMQVSQRHTCHFSFLKYTSNFTFSHEASLSHSSWNNFSNPMPFIKHYLAPSYRIRV